MYNMLDHSRRLKDEFIVGLYEFVSIAMNHTSYTSDGEIRSPCLWEHEFCTSIWVRNPNGIRQKSENDMLSKARVKRTKPTWTRDEASDPKKFKERSSQNKVNQSSSRGGALPLTGCKSHLDITLGLPDELFLATPNKKNSGLVDGRSHETYQISAAMKIQCWKDVTGGKSKGRVHGTADLAANICHEVSSFTQLSLLAATID
ncbi:hypothetical protein V8G54_008096 [Vigna mungo]|uniref:Uncharacterized protein n=1 Tax=Vigna mungo TaxID=3915 RepID=A0AAQ3P2W3_VIGMU